MDGALLDPAISSESALSAAGREREGWSSTVDEMISFGLRDLPEDQGKIIGYLTTFFGAARRAQTGGAMNR